MGCGGQVEHSGVIRSYIKWQTPTYTGHNYSQLKFHLTESTLVVHLHRTFTTHVARLTNYVPVFQLFFFIIFFNFYAFPILSCILHVHVAIHVNVPSSSYPDMYMLLKTCSQNNMRVRVRAQVRLLVLYMYM